MLGLSTTVLCTWETLLVVFPTGLENGGRAGLIYSFLLSWIGIFCIACSLSELSSLAPTSAGQYYFTSILAPKRISRFLSYLVGCLTVAVWQGIVISSGYVCARLIQGMLALNSATYVPRGYHATLLLWAAVAIAVLPNTLFSRALPQIYGFLFYLHLLGFFAILVPLVYLSKDTVPATTVFSEFRNEGEFPTMGLSFLVGMMANVGSLLGEFMAIIITSYSGWMCGNPEM